MLRNSNAEKQTEMDTSKWWVITNENAHTKARAMRWLDDRLKQGKKKQFAEVGTLSPELADILLSMNPENRSVSDDTVKKYAKDIQADRWVLNGESILISDDGLLNDGQHRCAAVLSAGKPIETMFTFGVSRESRTTVDNGKARTVGDFLAMEGQKEANNVAAIASNVLDIQANGRLTTGQAYKPTKQEVFEFAYQNDDIYESLLAVRKPGAAKIASLSVLGTAHYFFSTVDPFGANYFIQKLIDGAEMKARDPIFVVREKLRSRDVRFGKNEQLKALYSAWNNYRLGRQVRTLTHAFRRGERLPELK